MTQIRGRGLLPRPQPGAPPTPAGGQVPIFPPVPKAPARIALISLALAVAAVCVRAALWQYGRLEDRRGRNTLALEALELPPLQVASESGWAPVPRFRRVLATGVFDYSREVIVAARPLNGAPGVQFATPLLNPAAQGSDTLLVVLRGWAYSPDARTVDATAWRERDTVTVEGIALAYDAAPTDTASAGRTVRNLARASFESRVGAPLAGYYVLMTAGGDSGSAVPARVPLSPLTDGPHLSYAIQWTLFALIFGVGGPWVILRRARAAHAAGRSPRRPATPLNTSSPS